VPVVQRAHRRHERHLAARTAVRTQTVHSRAQVGEPVDGLHGRGPPIRADGGSDSRPTATEKEPAITAAHRIVFANEKGGTGKSTTAVHVAVALAYQGAKVAALDLDPRQRTLFRYFENRAETEQRRGVSLPGATFGVIDGGGIEELEARVAELAEGADFVVFDTPGRDDALARHAATQADTLVTPMNDSFVDFDLIGQVDAETFKVRRLSFYAELIWEARKDRAMKQAARGSGAKWTGWWCATACSTSTRATSGASTRRSPSCRSASVSA
jgi:hypothetical protein